MFEWLKDGATVILAFVGLWLANSYRLRMRASLSSRITDAYARLWTATRVRHPGDLVEPADRQRLVDAMQAWYFDDGNGIFMPVTTRRLFHEVIKNLKATDVAALTCSSTRQNFAALSPDELSVGLSCVAKRYMSLLRTQIKTDIAIHVPSSTLRYLRADEYEVLSTSGIRLSLLERLSSRFRVLPSRGTVARCLCGHCPA